MAIQGDQFTKANCGGTLYDSGENDTSTSYWTYCFGNSMWFRVWSGTASSIFQKHPNVNCQFWRFSISSQSWVQIDNRTIGKSTACIYQVRCTTAPAMGTPTAQYNSDDSYLFAFKAETTVGERSRCNDRIIMYNIGNDSTWDTTVSGKLIYGKPGNGVLYHNTSTAPTGITVNQAAFRTIEQRGLLITPARIGQMISVKSAMSHT